MKRKITEHNDKDFMYNNIGTALFTILGIYCMNSLYQYITGIIGTWNNDAYQNYIQLAVMMAAALIFFIIVIYQHRIKIRRIETKIDTLNDEIKNKNMTIEQLNDELSKDKLYDTTTHTWTKNMFIEYITQIYDKRIGEFTVADVICADRESEERFLLNSNFVKGKNVILFRIKPLEYKILFIHTCGYDADLDLKQLLTLNTKCTKSKTFNTRYSTTFDVMKEFMKERIGKQDDWTQ